jgi:hypothetical protein
MNRTGLAKMQTSPLRETRGSARGGKSENTYLAAHQRLPTCREIIFQAGLQDAHGFFKWCASLNIAACLIKNERVMRAATSVGYGAASCC